MGGANIPWKCESPRWLEGGDYLLDRWLKGTVLVSLEGAAVLGWRLSPIDSLVVSSMNYRAST